MGDVSQPTRIPTTLGDLAVLVRGSGPPRCCGIASSWIPPLGIAWSTH